MGQRAEGGERDSHSNSNVPSMLWKGEVGGIDSCQAPPSPGTPHAVLRVSTSYNTFLSQKPVPPLGEQPLYSHRKRSTLQRHPFTLFERTATLIMLEQEHSSAAVLHPSSSPAVLLPATRKQCPQPFELTCRAPPSHSHATSPAALPSGGAAGYARRWWWWCCLSDSSVGEHCSNRAYSSRAGRSPLWTACRSGGTCTLDWAAWCSNGEKPLWL